MTTLRKLGLRGVRSYSQTEEESIEFLKPLTIIVGANGSGKTTIIESLKFICTGTLPPLSDGGKSFVHDPKMEGTSLVKAQVKLSFHTGAGSNVLAIRNFQLAQKKAKREFKGMEAVLQTKDASGAESSVSHKCADMEKLVPQLMGVSPAVLENVIFCHQEDSLWPLSDAKTLKDKFDDIFAATRYTKALESIFKLRKEKATEIKIMEADLKVMEASLEQAHKLEDDLESTKSSIKLKTEKSASLTDEIKSLENKLAKLGVRQEEIKGIQDAISAMQAQKDVMVQEKQRANAKMQSDYSDTDAELRSIYENFRASHAALLKKIQDKTETLSRLESECVKSESDMAKLAQTLGKLAAQEQDYRKKKQELAELANRLGGGAAAGDHVELLSVLQRSFDSKRHELELQKTDAQALDHNFEAEIADLRKQESSLMEGTRLKSEQMNQAKIKRAALLKELGDLESAHRSMLSISDQLTAAESKLAALSRTHDPQCEQLKKDADAKMRAISSNTQKLTQLSAQRKQLSSQADSLAQIRLKRQQVQNLLSNSSTSFDALRRELEEAKLEESKLMPKRLPAFEALKDVLGGGNGAAAVAPEEYSMQKLEQQLRKRVGQLKLEGASKNEQVSAATASVSSLQSQRRSLEEQLAALRSQLTQSQRSFAEADVESLFSSPRSALVDEIARAEKVYDKANNESMLGSSAKLMYKRFITIAQESHKCHLCNREFANKAEEDSFLASNEAKMQKIVPPEKAEKSKALVKTTKTKLEQLQALLPVWDRAETLRSKDVPALQSKIESLQVEIASSSQRKSAVEVELKRLRETEESVTELLKVTAGVSRLIADVVSSFDGLRKSEMKLAAEAEAAGAGSRSLEVVVSEFEALERLNVTLQKECSAISDQLEHLRNRKQSLVEEVTKLKEQRMQMQRIEIDQQKLKKDEQENNAFYSTLKQEVTVLMSKIPDIKTRLSAVLSERDEGRRRSAQLERQLQDSVSSMQRELDQYRSLAQDVERFEKQLKDRAEMKQTETKKAEALTNMRAERQRLSEEIKADQASATRNEAIDVDIKANLEYRERERAIVAHQKKIDEKLAQLREASGGEILDDLRKLQARLLKLKENKSELRGAMASEEKQASDIISSLTSERYRNIDQRHTNALIDVKTHSLANADLDVYYRALDKALMAFHSIKMKEINETLKEYWQSVYKGADIDEIKIVSDGAIIGKKRNYNYRVVMKQGDTELDMRGRCSAGQKVLASLLIRLALADTFCSQCAVLALDEPTTNLDQKNITAFAQALNQIIQKRRDQSNFQLIVITHDETFVDEIGKRAQAEYYYRVYKDQAQHSKIRKQAIIPDEPMREGRHV